MTDQISTLLKVSPQEFNNKLETQILEAQSMLESLGDSKQSFYFPKDRYNDWDDKNLKILENAFQNEATIILAEYKKLGLSAGFKVKRTQPGNHKINILIKRISDKMHYLKNLDDQVSRIPITIFNANENDSLQKPSKTTLMNSKKVFIVHGHDNHAKTETARFIEQLGLEAIILHEQASGGKTIIEKIEEYSNVSFGIVLYTPCDFGGKQGNKESPRARQNVVFEHGYLIGKLGRNRVAALVKGDVETPNDISGVVYIPMNSEEWKIGLAKELRNNGLKVDMNLIL